MYSLTNYKIRDRIAFNEHKRKPFVSRSETLCVIIMGKVLSPDISLGRYSREKDARFARAESSPTDGSQERSLNYDGHCLAEEKGALVVCSVSWFPGFPQGMIAPKFRDENRSETRGERGGERRKSLKRDEIEIQYQDGFKNSITGTTN